MRNRGEIMLTHQERRNIAVLLVVVAILLVVIALTGGGDPGLPTCPHGHPAAAVECK